MRELIYLSRRKLELFVKEDTRKGRIIEAMPTRLELGFSIPGTGGNVKLGRPQDESDGSIGKLDRIVRHLNPRRLPAPSFDDPNIIEGDV